MQEVSGEDDAVDTGEGVTEMDEGVAERQEVALEITGDVTTEGTSASKDGSGDVMADETQVAVVGDEATLVMADDVTAPTIPDGTSIGMADEAYVDTARGITPVMADEILVGTADEACVGAEITPIMVDEASVGMANVTCVDTAYEITPIVANSNLAIIAGFAAKDSHDQDVDSVHSEETILAEPQPLQIIPFVAQRDEPRVIDSVGSRVNPPFVRMATIMEGISLFGVAPRFERVLREESSPVVVATTLSQGLSSLVVKSLLLKRLQFKMLMVVAWQTQKFMV